MLMLVAGNVRHLGGRELNDFYFAAHVRLEFLPGLNVLSIARTTGNPV
jgi:hypothetical protein